MKAHTNSDADAGLDSEPSKQPGAQVIEPDDMGSSVDNGDSGSQARPRYHDPPSRPKSPAYVAPIPKIGKIAPVPQGISVSPSRPQLSPHFGSFLVGRVVEESGDIMDHDTGRVLARAGGDLPAIVGRHVSNRQGDILGDDGELLGYVADVEVGRTGGAGQPRNLFKLMGDAAGLMVDHQGNILDAGGNVVGKFHDNNNPLHHKERVEGEEGEERRRRAERDEEAKGQDTAGQTPDAATGEKSVPPAVGRQAEAGQGEQARRPRRSEQERRENAEAWRKEKPSESPSDIFLDVKSTTEGIQLTIRIPTVFGNGQPVKPNITIS